jgi:hypothetical protein
MHTRFSQYLGKVHASNRIKAKNAMDSGSFLSAKALKAPAKIQLKGEADD